MVENGRSEPPRGQGPPDEMMQVERSRSSGVIFALVAIALILAIAFFYLTKERESGQEKVITEAAESADSAARVVGNAAQDAADRFRNRN